MSPDIVDLSSRRKRPRVSEKEIGAAVLRWSRMFPFAKEGAELAGDIVISWCEACGHLSAESWRAAVAEVERSPNRAKYAPIIAEVLEAAHQHAKRRDEAEEAKARRLALPAGQAQDNCLPVKICRLLYERMGGRYTQAEYDAEFKRLMAAERADRDERQAGEDG